MSKQIVGIRFQKIGKLYHFDARKHPDIKVGDFVVVETSRGVQLGEVATVLKQEPKHRDGGWKSIQRIATPRDLVLRQVWEAKEAEAVVNCQAQVGDLKLAGVKIITAEYTLDGKRLTFIYTSEGQDNVDLSRLRKAMKGVYPRLKQDFRQVGPRDAAKIIGGMGACGIENRCCSRFLTEFSPISIKMAKTQGISLAPSEITGMCGRLRCCLHYEYEQYAEAMKELPRRGKRVKTPLGEGKVINVNPLKETILVYIDSTGSKEFSKDDVTPWTQAQASENQPRQQEAGENKSRRSKNRKR